MKAKIRNGAALATAAALLFGTSASQTAAAAESTLSCFGVKNLVLHERGMRCSNGSRLSEDFIAGYHTNLMLKYRSA